MSNGSQTTEFTQTKFHYHPLVHTCVNLFIPCCCPFSEKRIYYEKGENG